jgi:NADH-quinone oxidoreductase subunit M
VAPVARIPSIGRHRADASPGGGAANDFSLLICGLWHFHGAVPFHTWVPDGHSSAPTAASMFLAGISMKLGGYGCLRVAVFLMPDAAREYSPHHHSAGNDSHCVWGFCHHDAEGLEIYQRVFVHQSLRFYPAGYRHADGTAITGAVMQMISHGLMTALFFAAIGMIYDRTHTRMVERLGGLLKIMPFISTVFVIAGLCSLGLPGLSGFVSGDHGIHGFLAAYR